MRIGVISDSHGKNDMVEIALEKMGPIDALLHAGDYGSGFRSMKFAFPTYVVPGNCDWDDDLPDELTIVLAGKKILLTHGHKYDIKTRLIKLEYAAEQDNADIIVFGHSHVPYREVKDGRLYLNPGSITRPRGGSVPSCVIITIQGEMISSQMLPLK